MVQSIQAGELTLHDLEAKFGLREAQDSSFFLEWQSALPTLTEEECRSLDQLKSNFLYLRQYPMSEEAVKLVVLSPLLSMAGFFSPPFHLRTEASIQIALEDEDQIIRGRIDVLVLKDQFWVLVVEAKKRGFSLDDAIAQALAYMIGSPNQPAFGFATNGSDFIFLKSTQQPEPQFSLSDQFGLRRQQNELYSVLGGLKRICEALKS